MLKVFCMLAIVAAVSGGISHPVYPTHPDVMLAPSAHQLRIVKREAIEEPKELAKEAAAGEQDDMDKAETFGFGYHKVIHVYPRYYPSYYPGYYGYGGYPSFYSGYHHGYYY